MIGANAHRRSIFLADPDQGNKPVPYPLNLAGIFLITVLNELKLFLVNIIAWIHPYFFNNAGGDFCSVGRGVWYPLFLISFLIFSRFSASVLLGAVMRISSAPASIQRMDCSTVALVSIVSGVVMVWTRIGASPPIIRSPTFTGTVLSRSYCVREEVYNCMISQAINGKISDSDWCLPILVRLVGRCCFILIHLILDVFFPLDE